MRLSSLLLLALALGLSACDTTGIDSPDDGPGYPGHHPSTPPSGGDDDGSDGGDGDGEYDGPAYLSVDPTATFLRTSDDSDAGSAEPIRLADLGLKGGDAVCLKTSGDYWLYEQDLRASDNDQPFVIAVFSASDGLDGSSKLRRVTGALNAGDDVHTPNTFLNDRPTNVAEDFDATDACVSIPSRAEYLFLSAYDSYFGDNSLIDAEDDPLIVTITRH